MRITSTADVHNGVKKFLIYGDSGSGKTTLARTLKEPTLIISAESGTLSLRGTAIDVIDISQDDNGDVIPPEKRIDRLGEVYNYIMSDEARAKYKNIFIDSLTEISHLLLANLKLKYPERSQSFPMYGELAEKTLKLVKKFRDNPHYNIIIVALSSKEKDNDGKMFTGVNVIGKISHDLISYFDECFFLGVVEDEKGETRRILQTGKSEKINCKDRSTYLEKFEPADLGLILNKIKGEK